MTGQVFHINRQRDMYSIRLPEGSFTIIETAENLEFEEAIDGNLNNLGFEIFKSIDSGLKFDCIVQNINCSESSARQACFLL
jgi:hypothetical protein